MPDTSAVTASEVQAATKYAKHVLYLAASAALESTRTSEALTFGDPAIRFAEWAAGELQELHHLLCSGRTSPGLKLLMARVRRSNYHVGGVSAGSVHDAAVELARRVRRGYQGAVVRTASRGPIADREPGETRRLSLGPWTAEEVLHAFPQFSQRNHILIAALGRDALDEITADLDRESADLLAVLPPAAGQESSRRKVKKPNQAETSALAAAWLESHRHEAPVYITQERIARETGTHRPYVHKSPAWQEFSAAKKAGAKAEVRTVPLSVAMTASIPAEAVGAADALVAEVAAFLDEDGPEALGELIAAAKARKIGRLAAEQAVAERSHERRESRRKAS